MMRFLEDNEIRLRAVEPEDAEAIWRMETDSTQWVRNGMAAPYSLKNIRDYAESYDADPIRAGQIRFVVCVNEKTAGLIDLYDISALNRTAFVGIYLSEEYRHGDCSARALALLEKYAEMLLNLRILAARIASGNTGSIRLFTSRGYTHCGELPGWILSGAETENLEIFCKKICGLKS